jgi:hypothetical protein
MKAFKLLTIILLTSISITVVKSSLEAKQQRYATVITAAQLDSLEVLSVTITKTDSTMVLSFRIKQ